MIEQFGQRLQAKMAVQGQLCVGIDPHPELLLKWGLGDDVVALKRFSHGILDAVADLVPVIKPQVALFERFGSAGIAVLEELLAAARAAGVLTIADAKRGDIGSTMAAYASAWLDDASPLVADAVTLSPYLGFGSLRPALELAERTGRGVFVLALTSNPEGASVQHTGATEPSGSVAAGIVREASAENARVLGQGAGWGSTGLVVGATVEDTLEALEIDLTTLRGPILAPGLGAQGATGADLRRVFGAAYPQVLATSSRGIAAAGPNQAALREATERTLADL
ncbi:orotidine-5'-phosphate decarboxylase [Psychromicrobium lacuslunae]|uniref:Orotidine 5'-phosphate decarboxylase n=1 Tax=Psychromicrobium lacuslunae TaxID=1618207 RepID=A0A0D4BXY0_9MICC|nr:orotidine-5'-phosphate decarboxylase [Psychromicrobium lacuslunae]AJT40985.1 orotidine 5'-phosphate decarboxylase [Psychromicrobium lacuslunae]